MQISNLPVQISLLNYLRTQHPGEWHNFIERMLRAHGADLPCGATIADVMPADFAADNTHGMFSHSDAARLDVMKWASERGQVLWRTVRGMSLYLDALRLLDRLEHADARHGDAFFERKHRRAVLC